MAPDHFVVLPVPPDGLFGKTFDEMLAFHRDRGIPHLRSVDSEQHRVRYDFAYPADADAFGDRFGGIVDPLVTTIRDDLIPAGSIALLEGYLKEHFDKTVVEIRGAKRALREGQYGALERLEVNGSLVRISGWALDRDAGQPADMVHIFDSGVLVRSVAPSLTRSEFALGTIPIGFQAMMPTCDLQGVAVVAEFANGSFGRVDRPVAAFPGLRRLKSRLSLLFGAGSPASP
jgi:hypothetical protein